VDYEVFLTCDTFCEARVDKVIDRIDDTGYKGYFTALNGKHS